MRKIMLAMAIGSAKDYAVLGQAISKQPFRPAVRQGDDQFADIVRWTLFAMIEAEEYGITSKNGSPLKIPRSLNALWTKAGIFYVPPIR
jgi:hypothetical protein